MKSAPASKYAWIIIHHAHMVVIVMDRYNNCMSFLAIILLVIQQVVNYILWAIKKVYPFILAITFPNIYKTGAIFCQKYWTTESWESVSIKFMQHPLVAIMYTNKFENTHLNVYYHYLFHIFLNTMYPYRYNVSSAAKAVLCHICSW